MIKIVGFIAFFFSSQIFCQAKLNYTAKQLRQAFPNEIFEEYYTNDSTRYIYFEDKTMECIHFFSKKENITNSAIIIPNTNDLLNYLIEECNKHYVIINNKKWRFYSENGILNIELIYRNDGGRPYLYYTLND
ncbi:MAG: hypothetical protein SFY32_11695 [Bacteroidota bacterium]|nr:hypothetical protein [Bacteroidota bacterium]